MKKRIESLQVIRGIAFLLVFLSHAELISTGPVGVSLFLVLSGFCMTYAYLDRPEKTPGPGLANQFRFAWGKVKKLYPLHLITLLMVALVVFAGLVAHRGTGEELARQGAYLVANASLLQSWIPWSDGYFSFNAVSWYLSTTAFCYFLFPWAFTTIQSKDSGKILRLTCVTLGSMIVVAFLLGLGQQYAGLSRDVVKWIVYICPLYRAGDFIVGLVAGYVFVAAKNKGRAAAYTAAEVFVLALMILQVAIYHTGATRAIHWTLTLFWLPTSVLCVYLFAVNAGAVSRCLSKSRGFLWLGNISGEAFLIHQICIKAVEAATKNRWMVAVVGLAATLLCTVIWKRILASVETRIMYATSRREHDV